MVATGDVHYLHPWQQEVHDVLICIRRCTTLEDARDALRPNAEYILRSPREMAALFADTPLALENSFRIAERCASAVEYLPAGPQTLPRFPVRGRGDQSADSYLHELCHHALRRRYSHDRPRGGSAERAEALLGRELTVIRQAGLADYFLIVWDIIRFGPFRSLADFCRRTKLGRRAVEALIWAGAFDGWGVPRRQLLWDLQAALVAANGPPSLALPPTVEGRPRFGFLSAQGRIWTEVAHTGVGDRGHITALVGDRLRRMGITPSGALPDQEDGCRVWVGGVIVSAQRPPTAKGTAFLALEDEGGLINVVLRPEVYEASREALRSPFMVVEGRLQRRDQAISVLARRVIPLEVGP